MIDEPPLIELKNVRRSFGSTVVTEVLHGINLTIARGEFVALIGASGSGKSTLLNQIGLLDRPSSGEILLGGRRVDQLPDEALTRLRNETLGFIFQFHHLLSAMTALQNLLLPLAIFDRGFTPQAESKALRALDNVGLLSRRNAYPHQLSGGEQQRVAIARALVTQPDLILADEPTGNLDSKTAGRVFAMLREMNQRDHKTFLLVTHDRNLAARCDRAILIEDGHIRKDGPAQSVVAEL